MTPDALHLFMGYVLTGFLLSGISGITVLAATIIWRRINK